MTWDEFIVENKITAKIERISGRPDDLMGDMPHHWKVTLCLGKKQMTVYFSGGSAVTSIDAQEVLNSVASDASGFDNAKDPFDFIREFGYEDLEQGEKVYKACGSIARKLKRFLGNELYEKALYEVEPL